MKDIETRIDVDLVMRAFYERALEDDVIGYIFNIAGLDLEKHLPIIGDFWESLLFGTSVYAEHGRNPLAIHKELDLKTKLRPEHFARWLAIFSSVVDREFEGERASLMKSRAQAIAVRMQKYLIEGEPPVTPVRIVEGTRPYPQ